jgi:uncharacterized repeat protein (TIGR01451 family)
MRKNMPDKQMRKLATLSVSVILSLAGVVALLWLLSCSPKVVLAQAGSGIIRVATSGSDSPGCGSQATPCRSVQHAVDIAASGDEIRVASGVYTGVNHYGGLAQVVYVSKTVTIRGGYTASNWTTSFPLTQPTVLDAQDQGRVLYIQGPISPTLEGLRLINGNAFGLDGVYLNHDAGGGAYIAAFGARLQDCWIADNAAEYGAGVYLEYSPATFNDNVFTTNHGEMGGGLFLEASSATLNDNVFINNSAGRGAGLALQAGSPTLNHNIIANNAGTLGGGVDLFSTTATLKNNMIIGNTANEGGGLHVAYSVPVLDGNLIKANKGSGLFLRYIGNAMLVNNIIAQNVPEGLRVEGSSPKLVHNTVAYNDEGSGAGINVRNANGSYTRMAMTNTILVGHYVGIWIDPGNTVTLETTLWDNTIDWMGPGTIVTGTHNYSGSADFVDPTNDDYHLGVASAALDRGITTALSHDIDGEARPQDAVPDLGADELPKLSIIKSAPSSVTSGNALTYALTIVNNDAISLTNLVVTDSIPAGAAYLKGGTRVGDVVSWTIPSLAAYTTARVTYTVTSSSNLFNADYGVSASGGYGASGKVAVLTLINERRCWARLNDELTDYADIQAAVDASTRPNDVVKVAGYCAKPVTSWGQQVVRLDKTLTLRGGYTTTNWVNSDPVANPTTIDARRGGRGISIYGGAGTVEGFHIINGDASLLGGYPDGSMAQDAGGGVYIDSSGVTFKNNHVSYNSGIYGGGVFVNGGAPTLSGNTIDTNWGGSGSGLSTYRSGAVIAGNNISRNHALEGGGVYVYELANSRLTLKANTIVGNVADSNGGGVCLDFSTPILEGNRISGNRADRGGGVYADTGGTSGGIFKENLITANSATNGGGLYLDIGTDTLHRNRITGNSAAERGGGVYEHSNAQFFNNLIADNHADGEGSGISFESSDYLSPPSPRFRYNTIARNSGSSGIYLEYSVRRNLVNTIIASHTTGVKVGFSNSTANLDATLWYGNVTDWSGSVNHSHDYFDDPAFLEPDRGNYHIGLDSGAIDRGIAAETYEDIDGDPRPQGAGFDIGADETGLVITKQAHPGAARAGALLTYTLRITNYSHLTLTATITDVLPDHVSPGGILTWTAGITAPGGTWVQSVPVSVDRGYMGVLTNVVAVTTQEGAGGAYTATTQVQAAPALAVSKQAEPDPVQAGARMTYTIRITNTGNVALHSLVTDTLPAHVIPSGVLTWTPIITAPEGVWIMPVVVTVETGYTRPLTNVVQVTSDEGAAGVYTHTVSSEKPGLAIYLPVIMRGSR